MVQSVFMCGKTKSLSADDSGFEKDQRTRTTEELEVTWFAFDPKAGIFLDSETQFRGLPHLPPAMHQFGAVSPGEGPKQRMLVM